MTPTVHRRETNVAEIIGCYCFLSTPKIVYWFNDYNDHSLITKPKLYNSFRLQKFSLGLTPLLCLCLARCLRRRGHEVSGDWQLPVAQLPHQDRVRAGVSVLPGAVLPPWKWGSVIAFFSISCSAFSWNSGYSYTAIIYRELSPDLPFHNK